MKLTPEEVAELKELLPERLHKWIGYELTPEVPPVEKTVEVSPVVTPKPKLTKRKAEYRPPKLDPSLDLERAILNLALSDDDDPV